MRFIIPPPYARAKGREKGYVYFQEFIPNNEFDVRIVIIGEKALGEKRFVRKNDFRASGSGLFSYEGIDPKTVKIAFDISKQLKTQCLAFDFIYDKFYNPLIVEISYGFGVEGIGKVPGYWDQDLIWHEGKFDPYGWMVDLVLQENNE
jgi:glutathione synthase/RimK-type ligase-like ATP-grasp enzyme